MDRGSARRARLRRAVRAFRVLRVGELVALWTGAARSVLLASASRCGATA
jgi:hypothetical protein